MSTLFPTGIAFLLVGDGEIKTAEMANRHNLWQWDHVLRLKGRAHIYHSKQKEWHDSGNRVKKPGPFK
jgi:hypothetical protein